MAGVRSTRGELRRIAALAVSALVIGVAAPLIGAPRTASAAPKAKVAAPVVASFSATPAALAGIGGHGGPERRRDRRHQLRGLLQAGGRAPAGDARLCHWLDVGGPAGQRGEEAQALHLHPGGHRLEDGEGEGQGHRRRSTRTLGCRASRPRRRRSLPPVGPCTCRRPWSGRVAARCR